MLVNILILFSGIITGESIEALVTTDIQYESLKFIPRDASPGDQFGHTVSFSENHIAIGSPFDDVKGNVDSGSVTIYTYDGKSWGTGTSITPDDLSASKYFGNSVAIRSNRVIIGAYGDDVKATNAGAAYIYAYDGQRWIFEDKITASDGAQSDYFSYKSVDIDGIRAVVGSIYADAKASDSGAAYVYAYNGSMWLQEQKLVPTDGSASSYFGCSVALDGRFISVGAYYENSNHYGAVYTFELDREIWHQQIKLQSSLRVANGYFGHDVALQGDRLVVGAHYENSGAGCVYVYTRNGKFWVNEKKLVASDTSANYYFGYSLSTSRDIIAIGAYGSDDKATDTGTVYIFKNIQGHWREMMKLQASDAAISDYFGYSVAVSNNKVIVGSYLKDSLGSNSGSAYLYDVDVVSVSIQKENVKLLTNSISSGDLFGHSVDIDGDYVIVGSPNDNVLYREDSGSVYIYTFNGIQWSNGVLIAPNDGKHHDHFGYSVAIDSMRVVIGSPDSNDKGFRSGSAYIYRYDGELWLQEVKLIADDGSAGDNFGHAVDIHQNYAIVSSVHDGDKGSNSGSVYVFVYNGSHWRKQSKLVAKDGASNDLFGYSLAINGDFIVVGSYLHDFNKVKDSGAIYIYKRLENEWVLVEKMGDQAPSISGWFGHTINLDANRLILGCHTKNSYTGSVFIFRRQRDSWNIEQEIFSSEAKVSDWFGYTVAIHGDNVVVGSRFSDGKGSKSGSAYVYKFINGKWVEVMKLVASDGNKWDQFGNSVGISNGKVVSGSPYNDAQVIDGGSTYVFNIYFDKCSSKNKYSYFYSVYNNRQFTYLVN